MEILRRIEKFTSEETENLGTSVYREEKRGNLLEVYNLLRR